MTAANFTRLALPFTLRYEGGKVDDLRDPGGRTNQGVTQKTFAAYLERQGQPARDVYTMTAVERDAIYHDGFWVTVKADSLPDGVDLACFDYGVNSGPARALRAYGQRTTNDAAAAVKTVCAARLSFDSGLSVWNTFKKGWTARVAACEALGVKMAEHARIGVPVDAAPTPGTAMKLNAESKAAADRAAAHKRKAVVAGAGGVAAHPAASAGLHLSWPLMVIAGIVIVGVVAVILWRASQQGARSAAYAAVANESTPSPSVAVTTVAGPRTTPTKPAA